MNGRVVGVVLLVVSTAACGLGDKQHRADAIIEAVDRAVAAGSARGVLKVGVELLQLPDTGRQPDASADSETSGPPMGVAPPPAVFDLAVDFARRRAVVARGPKQVEIYDDLDLYATRIGASERDVRPWLRLRLADLEEGTGELRVPEDNPIALASAISPVVLVDLAAGALAGSIERGERTTIGDIPVTRYRAAFDVEKAFEKTRRDSYPEEEREALEIAFGLLTVKGGVNQGTAWVDDEGRLRRFRLQVRVSRQRDFVFGVRFDLSLVEFGTPVKVDVPTDEAILEADTISAFLRSVVPELASQEAA